MNKKLITTIIAIMAIALIGLVSIQLYWIKSAILVKEATFNRSVSEAVSNVVNKIEKIELTNKLKNSINLKQSGKATLGTLDSSSNYYFHELELYAKNFPIKSNTKQKFTGSKIQIQYIQKEKGKPLKHFDTSIVSINSFNNIELNPHIRANKNKIFGNETDKKFGSFDEINNMLDKITRRSSMINEIFNDFISNKNSSEKHNLRPEILDSLIENELQNKGIKTQYEFGIYNPINNLIYYQKTGKYTDELLEKGYIFNLFPNDIIMNRDFLLLYFPEEKSYLLTQMWLLLTVSAFLILVIIFSFTFTIFVIFRQKKLSEMKNDFINNMTHEFKTPISTISLVCEALNDKDIKKSEQLLSNYINVINDENKRLGGLAEKILQTAIIEKGQLKLKKETFDIHDKIIDIIKNISLQVEVKGGSIKTNFKAAKSLINADKIHITNVLYNLLDNANKYTPENPEIIITTKSNDTGFFVSISDNGIGINKSNQKKIFENLYRVSTGNIHDVKGFGLGLSYVKAIVEKHNGYITVESELKKGSVFTVFLPIE